MPETKDIVRKDCLGSQFQEFSCMEINSLVFRPIVRQNIKERECSWKGCPMAARKQKRKTETDQHPNSPLRASSQWLNFLLLGTTSQRPSWEPSSEDASRSCQPEDQAVRILPGQPEDQALRTPPRVSTWEPSNEDATQSVNLRTKQWGCCLVVSSWGLSLQHTSLWENTKI